MCNSVTCPVVRHMLGYTYGQQTSSLVSSHDTWRSSALTNIGMSMFGNVMRHMPMLHNGLQVDLSVHWWHLALVCSRISSPCIINTYCTPLVCSPWILKQKKTIISSIPICYTKCHNVNKNFTYNSYICWLIISYWQLVDMTLGDL